MRKEIKDKWLEALKSGKFIQTIGKLRREEDGEVSYCCLGVLDKLCGLGIVNESGSVRHWNGILYFELEKHITREVKDNLMVLNDTSYNPNKRDYSNVIPYIERLETV